MYKQKVILTALVMLFMIAVSVPALAFNLMTTDELKVRLDNRQPIILLDIQNKNAYQEHHFYGSFRTYAYPAKTDAELENTIPVVRMHEQTGNDVVIIGPHGGRASQRTVDFLKTKGIPEEQIFILQGGIKKWPHKEMLISNKTIPH